MQQGSVVSVLAAATMVLLFVIVALVVFKVLFIVLRYLPNKASVALLKKEIKELKNTRTLVKDGLKSLSDDLANIEEQLNHFEKIDIEDANLEVEISTYKSKPSEVYQSPYAYSSEKQASYEKFRQNVINPAAEQQEVITKETRSYLYAVLSEIIDTTDSYYLIIDKTITVKSNISNPEETAVMDDVILDCCLLLGDYNGFFKMLETPTDLRKGGYKLNIFLTPFFIKSKEIHSAWIAKITGLRSSPVIKENKKDFIENLIKCLDKYAAENGGWLSIIEKHKLLNKKNNHHIAFAGLLTQKMLSYPFGVYSFDTSTKFNKLIASIQRDAENVTREAKGLPHIGQGWVSETKLYNEIKDAFPDLQVVQHGSPDWLGLQHFDIWMPELNIAIEYHGKQHFEPVEFFGGEKAFIETLKRDKRKERLCIENNVDLILLTKGYNLSDVVNKISKLRE